VAKQDKPVAKSLHTITVIVQVARDFMTRQGCTADEALTVALQVLALDGREDPYGLAALARKQLG